MNYLSVIKQPVPKIIKLLFLYIKGLFRNLKKAVPKYKNGRSYVL